MEKYELVKDIGSGYHGVVRLMRNKETKEHVAMKYLERGHEIDESVESEIINHRSLCHPNIIRFKEVILWSGFDSYAPCYRDGVNLYERIWNAVRLSEDEARYFFQQLVSGINFCHSMQICHRDLKPDNTLLDGSPAPCLKICDFGYSKSSLLHSRPKSAVRTPADIYRGKSDDVWGCGVTLYVMLVGKYPFKDQEDPKRIMAIRYKIRKYFHISQDCRHLLLRIFVANPLRRITIREIKSHPWFLKNLPRELTEAAQAKYYRKENPSFSLQSIEEIMKIVEEARKPPQASRSVRGFGWGGEEEGDVKEEEVDEEEEDEYEKSVKEAKASGEFHVS